MTYRATVPSASLNIGRGHDDSRVCRPTVPSDKIKIFFSKDLVFRRESLILALAQIARACGRGRLVGIRTRGRLTTLKGSTAGGEPANPAKRGTRLKATTDRAFSSLSASKADVPKRLVYLAGRAEGNSFHSNRRLHFPTRHCRASLQEHVGPTAQHLTAWQSA